MRWSGTLIVRAGGAYTFSLTSDDGSKLFLDSTVLVSNDGRHAMRTKEGQRTLNAGPHSLRLELFQFEGKAGMILKYKGADTGYDMIVVPARALRPELQVTEHKKPGLTRGVLFCAERQIAERHKAQGEFGPKC
jgi:hypothetical protein